MNEMPTDHANDYADEPEAPARKAPPRKRRKVADAAPYLRPLLELPGMDPAALDEIETATAWTRIESTNGAQKLMPLAHLAPDALDTLADLGFAGHTTFEIRDTSNGRALCYFAARLDDLDDDEGDDAPAGAGAASDNLLAQLLTRQQAQLNALAEKLNADPMAALEKSLQLLERVSSVINRTSAAIAPPPQPQSAGEGMTGRIIDTVVTKVMERFTTAPGAAPEEAAPEYDPGE